MEQTRTANSQQVGGTHYKTEYEHWDFCENNGLGCMEYAATKHITRHRTKGGIQDVAKARHYVQKLIELTSDRGRVPRGHASAEECATYVKANRLGALEAEFIKLMAQWSRLDDLYRALHVMRQIESQYAGG